MISININCDTPEQEVQEFIGMFSAKNIYDDVEELQQKVTELQDEVSQLKEDTGWLDLPLAEGIEQWSDANRPQYRRIGKLVFLRGAVKGITERNIILGTLPEGFRPSMTATYPQNTSMRTGNFAMYSRLLINANGEVKLEAITDGAAYDPTKWFPIGTVFAID